jgi:hypothetical protein
MGVKATFISISGVEHQLFTAVPRDPRNLKDRHQEIRQSGIRRLSSVVGGKAKKELMIQRTRSPG